MPAKLFKKLFMSRVCVMASIPVSRNIVLLSCRSSMRFQSIRTIPLRHYSTPPTTTAASSSDIPIAKVDQNNSLTISPNAVKQLKSINAKRKSTEYLRVGVDSGGCHGFSYKFELTSKIEDDDIVYKIDGETFVVDPVSFDLIVGSKVDYVDELIGSSFVVADNPKAESSCGCKISFNIKD